MGEEGQVTLTGGKAVTAGTVRESGNREAKTSVAWGLKSSGAGNLRRTAGGGLDRTGNTRYSLQ